MARVFSVFSLITITALAATNSFAQRYYESYQKPPSAAGNVAAVTGLEEELRSLTGRIEELENKVRLLEANRPAGAPPVPINAVPVLPVRPMPPLNVINNKPLEPEKAPPAPFGNAGNPTEALSAREIYDQGLSAVKRGDYPTSRTLLSRFIENNPSHTLLGNAHYWLGESYYAQNDYKEAAKHFLKGFQTGTGGVKAPDNLLKLAMSLHALGKTNEACTALAKMDSSFSDSDRPVATKKAAEKKREWKCV